MTALAPSPSVVSPATIPARRKLLPLAFFCVLFGVEPIQAIQLVDERVLWPAFNLAVQPDRRRLIRVWRGAVEAYQPGEKASKCDVASVITSVLPPLGIAPSAAITVRASELAYRWSVGRVTLKNLLDAGQLKEVGQHNSANETPRVSYDSARRFLEARLL